MPKISIIVPVYNVSKYIKDCVDSIFSQSFTDFELILVDDGSTDDSGKICDSYSKRDSRVAVIHKENGGLSSARNAGLDYIFANSNSEYISFIDSDDYVHPDFLKELLHGICDCDMALCYYSSVSEEGTVKAPNRTIFDKNNYWSLINANNAITVNAWDKLYKKELFKDIRYPIGRIFEDSFIIHDIVSKCSKIALVDMFLYFYRLRPNSIIHSHNQVKGIIDSLACKYGRVELYLSINNSKMFKTSFNDCFDYLVFSYNSLKKDKKNIVEIKEVFGKMKQIFRSKSSSQYFTRKFKFWFFFTFPKLYLCLISIRKKS